MSWRGELREATLLHSLVGSFVMSKDGNRSVEDLLS